MQDEVATDDGQIWITQFNENLDIILVQFNYYAVEFYECCDFFNDHCNICFEGKGEPYTVLENMLDADEYVNDATDAEAAADSYETYIRL